MRARLYKYAFARRLADFLCLLEKAIKSPPFFSALLYINEVEPTAIVRSSDYADEGVIFPGWN